MGTYHQLTEYQRYQIYALKKAGHDQQCIAATVAVSPSTISRELRRNQGQRGYRPGQAHHKALARRRHKAKATKMTAAVIERIEAGLRQQWSPEQISGRLEATDGLRLSPQRIYQHIQADRQAGGTLYRHLRHRQKKRKKRYVRVWPQARLLLVGALLTPSARTVASVLRTMGRSGEADFTTYHRVLNRAVWSARYGSRILLGVLIETFVPKDAAVVLGGDDTLERRGGRRIGGRGCYRDGVRSTGRHTVRCFGLKWVSLMVLVRLPWSRRVWALPFLTVLCPASSSSSGRRPKTSVDWMRQMLVQTRRWLPGRRLVLVVDGAYAALSLAWGCQKQGVGLVSRLRWDARLFHPPATRRPGQRGPTPQKGSRQRPLRRWATRRDTPWQTQTLAWYGGKPKTRWLFSAHRVVAS